MKTYQSILAACCGSILMFSAADVHAATALADYPTAVLADGPIAYWRFNETVQYPPPVLSTNLGSLGPVADGKYNGSIAPQQAGALVGRDDKAVTFAGAGKIDVPFSEGVNPSESFSVEFWAKPSSSPAVGGFASPLASVNLGAGRSGFIFYQSGSGTWQFRLGNASGYIATADGGSFSVGSWSHVVGVFDGGNAVLYVDGELAASVSISGAYAPNGATSFSIGARSDAAFFFNGSVDEVALYPGVLGEDVIAAHHANGISATPAKSYDQLVLESSPLGYWTLNDPVQPAAPVAVNIGTLGSTLNAGYVGGATTTDIAPRDPVNRGFEADNTAVDLNGSSAFVGTFQSLLNAKPAFTVSAWIRRGDVQANRTGLFGQNDLFEVGFIADNDIQVYTDGGLDLTPSPFANEEWDYVAVVNDGSTVTLYTNGLAAISRAHSLPGNTSYNFNIGGGGIFDGAGNFFKGQMDEVAVWDKALLPEQIGAHYFVTADSAPIVVRQPVGTNVYAGGDVVLSAGAVGTPPLVYKWFLNGTEVAGATTSKLVIPAITAAKGGSYYVEVGNAFDSVVSEAVDVTVIPEEIPSIVTAPRSITLFTGYDARFSVEASGGASFQYQWKFNGDNIPGATSSTYVRSATKGGDAGSYTVVVSNGTGSTTSAAAVLSLVVPAPGSYAEAVAASHPIAYYPLDESAGPVSSDFAGGNNADQNGGLAPGVAGPRSPDFPGFGDGNNAAEFNGTDAYLATGVSFLNNRQAFTLAGWVNPTAAQADRTGLWGQNDTVEYGFIDAETVEIYTAGGGYLDVAYPFGNGEWHFIVTVADAKGITTYIDAIPMGTDPTATSNYGSSSFTFNIGGGGIFDDKDNFFTGQIDSVAVYDRALSPGEICNQYLVATGKPFAITTEVDPTAGTLTLSYPCGTLESTTSLSSPSGWTPVTGAASPYSTSLQDPKRFYRLSR